MTIHVGDVPLTVNFDKEGHLQAGDMPRVTRERDSQGRDISIVDEAGQSIADFKIQPRGTVDRLELRSGLKFSVVKQGPRKYKETLTAPGGKRLKETVISAMTRMPPVLVSLDAVARQLGIGLDWSTTTTATLDETGALVTVTNRATGAPIVYVVRVDNDQVAFDRQGKVLFYDLYTDVHSGFSSDPDTKVDEYTYVPDHIVLTRDGEVGAYVWTPTAEGIHSFWTEQAADGSVVLSVRAGAQAKVTSVESSSPSSDAKPPRRSLRPAPLSGEGSSCVLTDVETCYSAGLGGGCADDYYWSCYGGTYYPDGSSGGTTGGGGGGYPSNHITTDATMHNAVSNGITNASAKLGNSQCANLLDMFTNANNRTLRQELYARGATSPSNFLQNYVNFQDGRNKIDTLNGTVPCNNGYEAWVDPPLSPIINICMLFVNATPNPGMQGVYTIHEMLHTLGLPEGGANMTSTQITNMVISACGR